MNPQLIQCSCQHCGGGIEFDAEAAGQEVECPHCHQTTWIYSQEKFTFSPTPEPPPPVAIPVQKKETPLRRMTPIVPPLTKLFPVVAALLFIANIFWFGLFLSGHHQANQLSEENARLKIAAAANERIQKEFEHNVQAAIDSQEVAGIYAAAAISVNWERRELDLRTDGTGTYNSGAGGSGQRITWTKLTSEIIEVSGHGRFKIENGDLIDARNARWLHLR